MKRRWRIFSGSIFFLYIDRIARKLLRAKVWEKKATTSFDSSRHCQLLVSLENNQSLFYKSFAVRLFKDLLLSLYCNFLPVAKVILSDLKCHLH